MRRMVTRFAAAALAVALPALALAGNQEIADQIAQRLRTDGQMSGYKIGVKCQSGIVWLQGSVASEEEMNSALKTAFQTPGVTRVVNLLSVGAAPATDAAPSGETELAQTPSPSSERTGTPTASTAWNGRNPLRGKGLVPLGQIARAPQRSAPAASRVSDAFYAAPVQMASANEEVPESVPTPMPSQQARPMPTTRMQSCPRGANPGAASNRPLPMYTAASSAAGVAPARYDQPSLPNYAWPSYAAYPNYASVTYPKQYSPTAWPYIGPFYPYPQVPLGWRKVSLQWDDGWWFLDFKDQPSSCWHR
jgi:hypothetical protein